LGALGPELPPRSIDAPFRYPQLPPARKNRAQLPFRTKSGTGNCLRWCPPENNHTHWSRHPPALRPRGAQVFGPGPFDGFGGRLMRNSFNSA